MSLRFYPLLLSLALLAVLNACGTAGTKPVDDSAFEQDQQPPQQIPDTTLPDRRYEMLEQPSDRSLDEIIALSKSMIGYQPDVALEIIRSLESVPSGQLEVMIDSQLYDPEFTEWLELALMSRDILINGQPVNAAAQNWANYHYGHVVSQREFPLLLSSYAAKFPVPAQVAILLPTDGGLAAAAKAIRDGILSAYLEQPGTSVIRFYSSGENSESAMAAYLQARDEGATHIIGPLRVESTRALASLQDPSVPILLLNDPGNDASGNAAAVMDNLAPDKPANNSGNNPGNVYSTPEDQVNIINSLSLSQAAEAEAIALGALAIGQKHAVVIVPDNSWGTRVGDAFTSVFQQGGGQVTASSRFNPAKSDHSIMLTHLLKIDESKKRKTDLQVQLGISLNFEPTRRDDFEFIFLAADPAEGRELKPLLRFHDAGDVPVYSMGRIFSGKPEEARNQDLNGVIFPTTPWQLNPENLTGLNLESIREGSFGHLYALGQDAWRLLPWLPLMQKDPDLRFPGDTGTLHMQAGGHIFRQPAWAQFSAGQPVAYQWPAKY